VANIFVLLCCSLFIISLGTVLSLCYLCVGSIRSRTFVASLLVLTLRRLMSYIYGAPILDVSRSHTTTQHSR